MSKRLPSSLGFVSLIGGVLFPLLLLVLSSLLAGGPSAVLAGVATRAVLVTFVFFLAGVAGLYLAQRDALGIPGRAGAAVLAVGLLLTIVEGLLTATDVAVPFEDVLAQGAAALMVVGAVGFGTATARAEVLLHARAGGVLLAAALPATFLGTLAMDVAGIQSTVLSALVVGVPFGLAWTVIGFDLMTIRDYGQIVEGRETT
ncbi:hypothetical protein BRC81_07870 [Halobacteriales archaeon QS_1_68_20]|nr:MAG: hypothetical protein BRC81_07870 [Halobacteriales archaeon QS_1_68_20]